nr:hypothetical protein [Streptomyces boncukensis]
MEVPVTSDLAGFAQELRTKVEAAAEGLAVKVKVKVDAKGLRKKLKTAVKEASKGVHAKIKVKVDDHRLRTELDAIARRVSGADVRLPVRPDGDSDGHGRGGGLLSRLRGLIGGAQEEADRTPVTVPVRMRRPRRRGMLRMLGIGSLLAVAQPAVAALTQYGAALTALVSAAAPAVGVLGALPGLITAAGAAAIGTRVAFGGFGEALKQTFKAQQQAASGAKQTKAQQQALAESLDGLSASARKTITHISGLRGAWSKMRQSVQERFFSKIEKEIKPLSSATLPLLRDSLGDAAGEMGSLAKRGAQFMQTGVFRRDFRKIAATNSTAIGHMTDGLANLGHASLDFLVGSGPFVERVSQGVERFTRWARASAKAGRETGSLARFLDKAGDKAAQLGRTTLQAGKGITGVGRAAEETGNALLDGLEGTMIRFNRWANSAKGQLSMKRLFSDAAPTFHELNRLVGDFFRGLGRAARDSGVTNLIRQIRTQLMPALGTFFNSIGHSIGPSLVSLVSNLATAIGNLSAAGSGLGVLLVAFNGLLHTFNSLMSVIPGANTALAAFLGTMLALKIVTGVAGMLRNLGAQARTAGASITRLGSTMRGTLGPGVVGPQISMWQRMGAAYRSSAQEGGRLTGTLRGVGAASRVVSRTAGGMVSALGGPLGLAITGVTIGLGLLASKQEAAARAAQAHEERIDQLSQALIESNGEIDANVRAQAAQLLQDTKVADGKGKLVDRMREAGVSLGELTDAYLEQDGSLGKLQKRLEATAKANMEWITTGQGAVQAYNKQGLKAARAADALKSVRGELGKAKQGYKDLAGVGDRGTDAFTQLRAAVDGMSRSTASADDKVNSLKRALDALNGGSESFHDAQTRVNAAILAVNDAIDQNKHKLDDAAKKLIQADGSINTASRTGQQFSANLKELRDSAAAAAVAAVDMAKVNGQPLAGALKKGQAEMNKARSAAVRYGMDLGLTKQQAEGLADKMGLMPETVTMLLKAKGITKTNTELLALSGRLLSLPDKKELKIDAPTGDTIAALRSLGFEVHRIPGTKKVAISSPTGEARTNLKALVTDLSRVPRGKKVTVRAVISRAIADLQAVKRKVASTHGKTIVMRAPTAVARAELERLGFKIRNTKGKNVRITVPTGSQRAGVASLRQAINSLRSRTITVRTNYVYSGKTKAAMKKGTFAPGGSYWNADGNIFAGRARAYANGGTERHVAQISPPHPTFRLWAEPETGGEAYIPLAREKRRRSEAILAQVARIFGGQVVYFAHGAVAQQASAGPMRLHRTSTQASIPRSQRTQAAAPALIGGDLNLTMTAERTTPGQALADAMYELRKIRRGGAHATA